MHLFLDLDETCVYSTTPNKIVEGFKMFKIKSFDLKNVDFFTYQRPHLDEFLLWAFQNHLVSFWSAGEKNYVFDIVKNIVPSNYIPKYILFDKFCDECLKETGSLKNMEWLKRKIPELQNDGKLLLVDDLEENCNNHCYLIDKFDNLK